MMNLERPSTAPTRSLGPPGRMTAAMRAVPAIVATRPLLPPSVKQSLGAQIDWNLTVIVALSFLAHFGLVGGMYSDWADPTVDADFTARFAFVAPPLTPPPVETQDEPGPSASAATSSDAPATHAPRPVVHPAPASPQPTDVNALIHEWEALRVSTIGSMTVGPNARRMLRQDDESAPVDLNDLYKRSTGVDDRPMSLGLPHASDPIVVGRPGDDLTRLRTTESPVASTAGTARPVVPFTMREDPPQMSAAISNAESVIRKQLQPRARQCYQHAVTADESLADGSIFVAIHVGPSGEVSSAGIASRTGLSPQVAGCIQGAASRLVFDPPGPGGATIGVPFHFVKQ